MTNRKKNRLTKEERFKKMNDTVLVIYKKFQAREEKNMYVHKKK